MEKNIFQKIVYFFDKLEDRVRHRLSRKPLFYALVGGTGVILFWRGLWHFTDYVNNRIFFALSGRYSFEFGTLPWWDGISSMVLGGILLLMTGVFVSSFIGNEVILTGVRGDKKIAEKTEVEVVSEIEETVKLKKKINQMSQTLEEIEKSLEKHKK